MQRWSWLLLLAACERSGAGASVSDARPPLPTSAPLSTTPVVVELFSSEGCSSCPPADRVLAELDRTGVPGAEVVALELHVDYWNDLGWADPFSRASYTDRQGRYGKALGRRGVYTPQMVIDGQAELVGSDATGARNAIAAATARPKTGITLTRMGSQVRIDVPSPPGEALQLYVAQVERGLATRVLAGENGGRTLPHGPVVRDLQKLPDLPASTQPFTADVSAPAGRGLVVFLAEPTSMKIRGAAQLR